MLALKITDVKDFMNKLLIGEVFDRFSLVEASVTKMCIRDRYNDPDCQTAGSCGRHGFINFFVHNRPHQYHDLLSQIMISYL